MNSEPSPTHRFTYHPFHRFMAWVGVLFFFGLTVVTLMWSEPYFITVAFTLFLLLSLVWAIWTGYSYEVYANGLVMRSILGPEHFLEWRNISAIKGNRVNATICLINQEGQTFIKIEPLVTDYPKLIDYLLQARPDLFRPTTNQFLRPAWTLWLGGAAGLLFLGLGLYSFTPEEIGTAISSVGMGLAIFALLLSIPQKLTLQDGAIRLDYLLFRPKVIPIQEIANIYTHMGPGEMGQPPYYC